MSRIEMVRNEVDKLYQAKNKNRADWADWLYENHVYSVANEAEYLAERFGAKTELVVSAAMLHDIADAVMSRFDQDHEKESLQLARDILVKTGFSVREIEVIVDDAIKLHGCHDGNRPVSLEGKIMATADAVVHLGTNFYEHAVEVMKSDKTIEEIKKWALPKIDRDFYRKICFEEVRKETEPKYVKLITFFQHLS